MTRVALGEVAEFVNGRAFKPSEWTLEGLPIIRIQNLTDSSGVTNYFNGTFEQKHLVTRDDILISWSASLGVYKWQKSDALLNQHIFKVKLKKNVDKDYFYHIATAAVEGMKNHVHGATMQHITKEPFEATLIPLPSLEEQKRIASILEKADRLRRLKQHALTMSDTYLQSVFLEMFGDPSSNPKGWDIYPLIELLQSSPQNGFYAPPDLYTNNGGIEMVHMSDLFYGTVTNGKSKQIKLSPTEAAKYLLSENDLLIARRSLTYEGAAKSCRVVNLTGKLLFESSTIRVKPNTEILLPVYLHSCLSNERYRKARILQYVTQSTISGINQDGVKSLEILLPPLELQEKFAGIVKRHERLRKQQQEGLRQAQHLYDTLLHQAFKH